MFGNLTPKKKQNKTKLYCIYICNNFSLRTKLIKSTLNHKLFLSDKKLQIRFENNFV